MKRYFIEEAKCGIGEGGFACGPVSGPVIVQIKYTVDGETKYIVNEEFEGFPNIYEPEEDVFDAIVNDTMDDDERTDLINDNLIGELDGISLSGEYEEIIESLLENEDSPAAPFVRYILALTRCLSEDVEELIKKAEGKFVDEIEIPISDIEEEYLEENEEE